MLAEKSGRYDTADYLDSEDAVRRYLEICQEDGDPSLIAAALCDIARAGNMSRLARDAGMTRAGLYKALSPDGNPSFATILKVARALGLKITIQPAS